MLHYGSAKQITWKEFASVHLKLNIKSTCNLKVILKEDGRKLCHGILEEEKRKKGK
jgi:hypothetical protein